MHIEKEQNSFLPDINSGNEHSASHNVRYKSSDLKEIKENKNIDNSIQRVGFSNAYNGSSSHIVSMTPLPFNPTRKMNFSNLNSNISLKPNQNDNISLSLSNQCLSCVGNKALINQAFKLACLNYVPSKVN